MAPPPQNGDSPHHQVAWLGSPPSDDARVPTLVLLHGYGSSEQDLISLVPAIGMFLPGVVARVIAVRGSHPAPGRARGFSWFPGSVMTRPDPSVIAETADTVAALIRKYASRAVVLGFSQGMATAVTVLRRHPELVSAFVGLSGFLFDDDQPGDAQLAGGAAAGRGVPAFTGYDPADPVIPAFANRWALTYLRTHTDLQEHSYPGMGHSVSMDEIRDLTIFLRRFLQS